MASNNEPARSRYLDVGGIRTHYLEAGDGPIVVLLHSGEFGGLVRQFLLAGEAGG